MDAFWEGTCKERTTKNHTPLTLVSMNGHVTIVKSLLLCNDVDFNAQTRDGETAPMLASRNGHNTIVKTLLDLEKKQ